MSFAYAAVTPPADYRCSECGADKCKLWREYQTMMPSLFCGPCALQKQGKSGPIDAVGVRRDIYGPTDTIGWLVPAVPDEQGVGYWGYTSVPTEGCDWWRALPLAAP